MHLSRKIKIKNRLILTISLVGCVLSASAFGLQYTLTQESLGESVEKTVLAISNNKSNEISSYIDNILLVTPLLAKDSSIIEFRDQTEEARSDAETRIKQIADDYDFIEEISLVDEHGLVILSNKDELVDKNRYSSANIVISADSTTVSDIYKDIISKEMVFDISTPLELAKKERIVVMIKAKAEHIYDILKADLNDSDNTYSYLINDKRYLLSPLQDDSSQILTTIIDTRGSEICYQPAADEQDRSSSSQINTYNNSAGKKVLGISQQISTTNWCILTEVEKKEAYSILKDHLVLALVITAVLILISIVSAIALGEALLASINRLKHGIDIIAQGDLDFSIASNSSDEIGELSRSLDKMSIAVKASKAHIEQEVAEKTLEISKLKDKLSEHQQAMLNILEDVEEDKKRSFELAKDLLKFQLAVDSASDHIVITDKEGIIIYANKAVEKVTGYSRREILRTKAGSKQNWGGQMSQEFYESLWTTISDQKRPFTGELTNRRKDGSKYIAEAHIAPVLDRRKNILFYLGIERDITKAKEIDKMKTEFISLASHQLRTPLTGLKWNAEMLLNGDAGELNEEQIDFIKDMYESNERMIELVNSLLNVSRIESGRIIVEPEPTDLKKLVTTVIEELQADINAHNSHIVLSVHENLPIIKLDPNLIRHVYMNLLTNAIKYSPKNSDISIFISKKDDQIISQITDEGYGIPKQEHHKIFQKFFRAENAVKLEADGSGLGLYLVKAIVESSGGKIWFDSELDKGTTFWFTIPISGMKAKRGEVRIDS